MKMIPFVYWFFTSFLVFIIIRTSEECPSSTTYSFEQHLSSKTPYRFVSNKSMEAVTYKGCRPGKVWMIVRHGTRNPNKEVIVDMKTRLPEIRKLILESNNVPNELVKNRDLDLFRSWKPPKLDSEDVKKLTHEGEDEMMLLGERMQGRFPTIFGTGYSNSSYKDTLLLRDNTILAIFEDIEFGFSGGHINFFFIIQAYLINIGNITFFVLHKNYLLPHLFRTKPGRSGSDTSRSSGNLAYSQPAHPPLHSRIPHSRIPASILGDSLLVKLVRNCFGRARTSSMVGVSSGITDEFRFTYSQRTKMSAVYFSAGLFGKHIVKDVYFPEPSKRDVILRFYKLCQKWLKDVRGRLRHSGQHWRFEKGPEMNNVTIEVNERLGLEKDNHLSTDDIFLIYTTCTFETAWNKGRKSPWCSLLTLDNFKVLEYLEDLRYYGRDGYSYQLSYMQACPTFGDMIDFLRSEQPLPKATVYFTHSGTMLKLLAHLGLYKDGSNLTAHDFKENVNRKWRTSQIDAFGSNLAFVLFKCGGDKKILTLHQESVIRLPVPSCSNEDLCDIEAISKQYEQSLESCNFNRICENEE